MLRCNVNVIFEFNFPPVVIALLIAAGVLALVSIAIYRPMLLKPSRHQQRSEHRVVSHSYKPVSVIVHARDNARGLEALLEQLFTQIYPAEYEVVVVNDGSADEVSAIVTRMSAQHAGLRVTFVPDKAYNLSRRKLAITLGVKAARYPYVIILDADCSVAGQGWLEALGRHFSEGKDVVMGHCSISGTAGAVVRTDNMIETVSWMVPAIGGRPYRAGQVNLGYSREKFFENKGFARSLNLQGGDDDLFIREITRNAAAEVELSGESIVTISDRDASGRYREERRSHGFTGRMLPGRYRRMMRLLTALLWAGVGVTVATGILAWPNMLPLCIAVALLLVQWGAAVYGWHKASRALHYELSIWGIIAGVAMSSLYTVKEWIRSRRNTDRNYTWYHNASRINSK